MFSDIVHFSVLRMSEELFLRWDDHHSLFFNAAEQLCQGDFLTDVTLSCGNRHFSAHKLVLSVCSGYFAKLFASRRSPPFTQTVVYLKDVDPKHLELILRYMYRGEISLSEDDLVALLQTAKGLEIKGLTDAGDTQEQLPQSTDSKRKSIVVTDKDADQSEAKRIKTEDTWTGAQKQGVTFAAGSEVIEQVAAEVEERSYEDVYIPGNATRSEDTEEMVEMEEVDSVPSIEAALNERTGMIEENPNQCRVCGQVFSRRTDIPRHMAIHTDEKRWKCFYCDYAGNHREALRDHCMRKHEMDAEEFKIKAKAEFPHKPRGRPRKIQ